MNPDTQAILHQVLALPAVERAEIASRLLDSLNRPCPAIDAAWAEEAEARIAAYEAGRLEALDEEQSLDD